RLYKQAYVDVEKWFDQGRESDLDKSIHAYRTSYELDPEVNTWPGINLAALLRRRKERERAADLAQRILDVLDRRSNAAQASGSVIPAWDVATRMEALIALDRGEEAARAADEYVRAADLSAFKLEATRRQLTEVWLLRNDAGPGRTI